MKSGVSKETIHKLVQMGKSLVKEIQAGKNPAMDIPVRALSNTKFDPKRSIIELGDEKQKRYFFNVAMAKKFMQTLMVATKCKEHIEMGKSTSLRDLYYMVLKTFPDSNEKTVEEQEETDECIEDLEVALDALREELHLFAANRGSIVGEITVTDKGDTIDCRRMGSGGYNIPSIVERDVIQFKKVTAKFVLMVEKDAVWRRLNEDKFWKDHKCILMTGQGQAPRGVRRLLYRIANECKLPVYVLTDNDPWGYYIYSVIKQGSINLAYESMRMAVPHAKFLGLSAFDAEQFKLKNTVKLDVQDINRAKQILDYPWFKKKEWQVEVKKMLECGVKLELEALSSRGISFISETYLPKKIKEKAWLD